MCIYRNKSLEELMSHEPGDYELSSAVYICICLYITNGMCCYLFQFAHSEASLHHQPSSPFKNEATDPVCSCTCIYTYPLCIYLVSHYKLQRHFYEVVKSNEHSLALRNAYMTEKFWRDCNLPSFFKQTSNQLVLVIEKNYHLVALLFLLHKRYKLY